MNFNVLVSAVQGDLNDFTARMKTKIEGYVNEGHLLICQKRSWWFMTVKESDTMTLGSTSFPLSLDTGIKVATVVTPVAHINSIYDITDGTYREVKKADYDQIRLENSFDYASEGPPLYYFYVDENKIEVYPRLSADRDFVFSIKKKLPRYATNSTAALYIPDQYIDTLKEFVLSKVYRFKSDERAESCYQNYMESLDMMVSADSKKTGITTDRFKPIFQRFPTIVDAS
jgi:hypothetical protein